MILLIYLKVISFPTSATAFSEICLHNSLISKFKVHLFLCHSLKSELFILDRKLLEQFALSVYLMKYRNVATPYVHNNAFIYFLTTVHM